MKKERRAICFLRPVLLALPVAAALAAAVWLTMPQWRMWVMAAIKVGVIP